MKKLALLLVAVLLLASVSCAPPRKKFDPDSVTVESPDYKPFTPVFLSEDDYEKQAQILLVRLSDYINTRNELTYFQQFYEGVCRYALVCVEPTGQRSNLWILFCYETNEREVLTENAALTKLSSKDDITFRYAGFDPVQSRYVFPRTVRLLRSNGAFVAVPGEEWLTLSDSINLGTVTQNDQPLTGPVLQLLDDLHFTASGIQAVFRRSAETGMQDAPFCEIRPDPQRQTLTLNFIGATAADHVQQTYVGADTSAIDFAVVTQQNDRIILEL
ncbi:MAG: hypothetical protein IJC25_04975, partial [Clostridia bacterium]|nr:hypothetical protein [Clostridia bacterium]